MPALHQAALDGNTLDMAKAPGVLDTDRSDVGPDAAPQDIRVAAMAVGQTYTDNGYVVPKHPYRGLEFWRDGVMEQKFERHEVAIAMKIAFDKFKTAGMLEVGLPNG